MASLIPDQPNVLIDSGGHARLTDLGLTAIVRRVGSVEGYQAQGYTARWTAPEVLRGANTITRKADIFSFGMVVPEVGFRPSSHLAPEVDRGIVPLISESCFRLLQEGSHSTISTSRPLCFLSWRVNGRLVRKGGKT